LGGIEVHVAVASFNPWVAIIPAHNEDAILLELTFKYGGGTELMEYELGLFPGLQNVSRCGPVPDKHIGCPTITIGPQFTW
jgi:hypothetical protein